MQKVVIDTNVLVSALIQRGYPYRIVSHLVVERKVDLCISSALLMEYYEVLQRRKFYRYPDFVNRAEILLTEIQSRSKIYTPRVKVDLISDKDDNKLLELASECNAEFLITGNTTDFTMKKFKSTVIVTPQEYWEIYQQNIKYL